MPIGIKVETDITRVIARLARLPKRSRIVTRRILNRQRRESRTMMTRKLAAAWSVKPMKRIRRRILLPPSGQATIQNLEATQLALFELMPVRWFQRRGRGRNAEVRTVIPAGATLHTPPGQPAYVDGSRRAYRLRDAVLKLLAKRFPKEYARQWRVELDRLGF